MVAVESMPIPACAHSLVIPKSQLLGCNGQESLCHKAYDRVAYATMHNAYSTTQDMFVFAQHRSCIRTALVRGMRGFMLDIHLTETGLKLCHYSCLAGSLSLSSTLDTFREFLEANPREIVTIFWETISDRNTVIPIEKRKIVKTLYEKAVLDTELLSMIHMEYADVFLKKSWPTLQTMVDNNRRLVMFSDATYVPHEWDLFDQIFIIQTSFEIDNGNDLLSNCSLTSKKTWDRQMPVINHFTRASSVFGINTQSTMWLEKAFNIPFFMPTNRDPFFSEKMAGCVTEMRSHDMFPTFVVVDFWESSDVLEIVNRLNNVTH